MWGQKPVMKIWCSIQMYCLWVFEKVKMSGMPSYFKVVHLLTREGGRETKRKREGEGSAADHLPSQPAGLNQQRWKVAWQRSSWKETAGESSGEARRQGGEGGVGEGQRVTVWEGNRSFLLDQKRDFQWSAKPTVQWTYSRTHGRAVYLKFQSHRGQNSHIIYIFIWLTFKLHTCFSRLGDGLNNPPIQTIWNNPLWTNFCLWVSLIYF